MVVTQRAELIFLSQQDVNDVLAHCRRESVQSETRDPRPETRDPRLETRNPEPESRNYITEICSGSKEGSYLRLIDCFALNSRRES